jgi:hypothetical protein
VLARQLPLASIRRGFSLYMLNQPIATHLEVFTSVDEDAGKFQAECSRRQR